MEASQQTKLSIRNYEDIVLARKTVREILTKQRFSLLEQTKILTAVSELARNIVDHAKEGILIIQELTDKSKNGVKCIFQDEGPGIANINQALVKGNSSTNSLGLGLGGAKNLSQFFSIQSEVGKGTKVEITNWTK